MTEMAFVAPLFFLLIFATIDFGRAIYTLNTISTSARAAARAMTLPNQAGSDCTALGAASTNGNGLRITPDPAALSGDLDPDAGGTPTSPPPGTGMVYLFPAVSRTPGGGQTQLDLDTSGNRYCDNTAAGRGATTVKARVSYSFRPLTPVISSLVPAITLHSESVQSTEIQ